jgi:hypothetical protein
MSRIPAVILQRRPAFFLINTQGLLFMRHFSLSTLSLGSKSLPTELLDEHKEWEYLTILEVWRSYQYAGPSAVTFSIRTTVSTPSKSLPFHLR